MTPTPSTTQETRELEPRVIEVGVRICEDCLSLKGKMCHNAKCVFCRRTMAEVGDYLDALLIAPVVDGERIFLPVNAVAPSDTEQVIRLREALEGLRQCHGCWCELPPNAGSPDHTVECDRARAALPPKA